MSVLLLPPIFQFFDDNGDPLAGGKVYTYAAGTTTPLATYTSNTGLIAAPNPIQLDAAGRPESGSGAIWGEGAYKFIVHNSAGVQVGDVLDNVTSFTTLAGAANPYFETFSGNGTQTVFTTSTDLGTEEKALLIWVDNGTPNITTNGDFATDTGWTKGAGWTIAAGVATATGAISTAISQTASVTLVEGLAYSVTYTITRSAGGLIPSIGGQNGTERTASGTYREVIIAGSSQTIAFTGNAFTGTLDTVVISLANSKGYEILNPSAYTINGTSLTFATAPKIGTNNIYVAAPSLLLGAASSAAALAQVYATNALTSETNAAISASSAAGYAAAKNQWTFSTTTTMADPATANLRLNNAALASVTQIAISDLSANSGNPDLGAWLDTFDDAGGSNRGSIFIFKDNANFAIYNVNSVVVDNTTWHQIPVTYIASAGSFSASDALLIGFAASGTTTVTGGITALTGDVTASGSGSVVATIANDAVTLAKIQNATANSRLLGSGASGSGADYSEITLGTNLSMSGTTLNAAGGGFKTTTTISASANVTFSSLDFANNTYEFVITDVDPATDATNFQIYASQNNFSTTDDLIITASGQNSSALTLISGEVGNLIKSVDNGQTAPYSLVHGVVRLAQLTTGLPLVGDYSMNARNSGNTAPVQMTGDICTSNTRPTTYYNAIRFQMSSGNMDSGTITMIRKPIS